MSMLDKVIAAVTPPESEEARTEARTKARSLASESDWLSQVLDHHAQIEAAFERVKAAPDSHTQREAQKQLAVLLTGHSIAEEAVLYPALVKVDEQGHSTTAYTEQSAAKVQMGLLEDLEPMSKDYMEKLDHIRGAVAHHVYEEEGTWFPELKGKLDGAAEAKLTFRYLEEFRRYMGGASTGQNAAAQSFAREIQSGEEVNARGDFP